jgi:hypothetical protein
VTFPLVPVARNHSLDDEMEAMAAIGRALESLADPDAQQRVLSWAVERYSRNPQPVTVERRTKDATLDLEDLNDLFVDEGARPREGLELVASKKPA